MTDRVAGELIVLFTLCRSNLVHIPAQSQNPDRRPLRPFRRSDGENQAGCDQKRRAKLRPSCLLAMATDGNSHLAIISEE